MAATVVVQILAYISRKPARLKIPVSELNCTLTGAAPNNVFSICAYSDDGYRSKEKTEDHDGRPYHTIN